ncbi:MAG: sulfurtransferase TusA family protein [Actinomycetota bacterium]
MEIDLRGLSCPIPAMRVKDTLAKEKPDQLTVTTDCSTPMENIEFVAETAGYECNAAREGDTNVIRITKRSVS